MSEIRFSSKAYCKMILHAAKYPHCSVNGLLLAEKKKDAKGNTKELLLVDTVPLFHLCLHLSPMSEVALMQVDAAASSQGLVIAGYYTANESIDDISIDKPSIKIADKVAEYFSSAVFVVIENRKVTLSMDESALRVMQSVEGKWKQLDNSSFFVEDKSLKASMFLIQQEAYEDISDFDNHLDDISQDWRNIELNSRIQEIAE